MGRRAETPRLQTDRTLSSLRISHRRGDRTAGGHGGASNDNTRDSWGVEKQRRAMSPGKTAYREPSIPAHWARQLSPLPPRNEDRMPSRQTWCRPISDSSPDSGRSEHFEQSP